MHHQNFTHYSTAVSSRYSRQSVGELSGQPDLHHRVVIFFTATTIPRWWSGKSKCESFIFIVFNCLAKALMQHTYIVGETSRALFVLLTTCKTLFQIRAGITPQDVLTSIFALAIILCLNLTLFVATPLSKLQQYSWTTLRHCTYT